MSNRTEQNREERKSLRTHVIARLKLSALTNIVHHSVEQTVEYRLGEVNLAIERKWDRLLRPINPFKFTKPLSRKDVEAFTLAEVLITLGIIGVVAVMTIPTLIRNYQEKETVTAFKETYSILSQAYTQAAQEYGTASDWVGAADAQTYMAPYFKIKKNCVLNSDHPPYDFCWDFNSDHSQLHYIAGSDTTNYYYHFILVNGVSLFFYMME